MPLRRPLRATFAVALVVLLAAPASAQPEHAGPPDGRGAPDRYIVTLVDGADPDDVAAEAERGGGAQRDHTYRRALRGFSVRATPAALRRLERDPRVAAIEVDGEVRAAATVSGSTTQTSPPWGLDRLDQAATALDGVYRHSRTGAGVAVHILDTGVSPHPDFGNRLLAGSSSIGGGTADCNGHGTHVAGIVAGEEHGVAKGASIVPVRVLDCDGNGLNSQVIAGLDWVVSQSGRRIANLSLSGAASSAMDRAVRNAVAAGVPVVVAAGNEGADACQFSPGREAAALTIAASTQSGPPTNRQDARASYSNFGSCVDLFAPGSGIRSTSRSGGTRTDSGTSMAAPHVAGAAALHLSAVPSATPQQVADALVAASTKGVVGNLGTGSPDRLLRTVATPLAPSGVTTTPGEGEVTVTWSAPAGDGGAAISGYRVTSSAGPSTTVGAGARTATLTGLADGERSTFVVRALNAVGEGDPSAPVAATPFTVPQAPAAILADGGDGAVSVSWAAPAFDGGSPITGYTVAGDGGAPTVALAATERRVVLPGLDDGVPRTFTVHARNARGQGPAATSASATPAPDEAATGRPLDVLADVAPGATTATVTWQQPPAGDGPAPTGYRVSVWSGDAAPSEAVLLRTLPDAPASPHSAFVPGLVPGVPVTFRVQALPVVGATLSELSNTVTPVTPPSAPTAVTATPGDRTALVAWSPPANDGGSAITGYRLVLTPSAGSVTFTGPTSATVGGLVNGTTYTVRVVAVNAAGDSPPSSGVAVRPRTTPGAPSGVTAQPGDGTATVRWSAPVDGGAPITSYTVTATPGGRTATTTGATTATVAGLANGTAHTFTVVARNVAGAGPASAPSSAVTPRTVPGAPRSVVASGGDGRATVTWEPPSSDGGAAITTYTVTASPGGATATTSGARTATLTGLRNGTAHTFTVRATNIAGTGAASAPSAAVTPLRVRPTAFDGDPATTQRIAEESPAAAAVAISQRRFRDADGSSGGPQATHVVLSRDDAFPDSLAGAPLTATAPLLLTGSAALPAATAAEIRRVLPAGGTIYLLGGEGAISPAVAAQVAQLATPAYAVVRLAGPSRIETALAIADEVRRRNPARSEVLVARAFGAEGNPTSGWADSVTGGAYGAAVGIPVVLVPTLPNAEGRTHRAVEEWLRRTAPSTSIVLGGDAAVSDAVALRLPRPQRVRGAERTATAVEVARVLWRAPTSGDRRHVVINGFDERGWAHGLASAGLAADHAAPLLLVTPGVTAATAAVVGTCGAPQVDLLLVGPVAAIPDATAAELDRLDGRAC